jgi:hypothetical protein
MSACSGVCTAPLLSGLTIRNQGRADRAQNLDRVNQLDCALRAQG